MTNKSISQTVSTFESVVQGLSNRTTIPLEIMDIIKKYYTLFYNVSMNLFIIQQNYTSSQITLFNIVSSQQHQSLTFNYVQNYNYQNNFKCIITQQSLPIHMQNVCMHYDHIPQRLIASDKWSMMLSIHRTELTAFHSGLIAISSTYQGFKFNIPCFPGLNPSASVYNKTDKMLYSISMKNVSKIYGLDFRDELFQWNALKGNLLKPRLNATACMVDNDRFIAVLGGDKTEDYRSSNHAELYALNCNKSIELNSMCRKRRSGLSLYHNKFHKIIVADDGNPKRKWYDVNFGKDGMEWYDINKDEWVMIVNETGLQEIKNIYISKVNPNMLYLIGCGIKFSDVLMYELDLRINLCVNKHLANSFSMKPDSDDFCALYL